LTLGDAGALDKGAAKGELDRSSRPAVLRLEVCVDTASSLIAAVLGGAHRIELCSALALAGLSPSPGLIERARGCGVSVYVMIRPRPGDFDYNADDLDLMRREIDDVRRAGLDGLVLGVSRPNGELDDTALRGLLDHADGLPCTLHRAFDVTPELDVALDTAIDLGFERILTSGGAPTAWEGRDRIAELVAQAGDKISIMAGAGVTTDNVVDLVHRTGVREVHASCSATIPSTPDHAEAALRQRLKACLGIDQTLVKETKADRVRDLLSVLNGVNPKGGPS
jgi:copper homeostasis protein